MFDILFLDRFQNASSETTESNQNMEKSLSLKDYARQSNESLSPYMVTILVIGLVFATISSCFYYYTCYRRRRPLPPDSGTAHSRESEVDNVPMNELATEEEIRRSAETTSESICSICLRKIKHGEQVARAECGHTFHKHVKISKGEVKLIF